VLREGSLFPNESKERRVKRRQGLPVVFLLKVKWVIEESLNMLDLPRQRRGGKSLETRIRRM